ncbi:single-stranded-DNA-specific exonuclease RecJ [TM7 phylum sp. oral taxon 348]|jgi:single-stranded-DNA-specific exonuclease recJ|nr:single-stranded-DNA-specific exonuclease RecJ [TM7 phylum sp. oral taxon 348]
MTLFEKILASRNIDKDKLNSFLSPDYDLEKGDPYLLPDMQKAVDRIKTAYEKGEKIVIYGDYDVDGISATALLLDAFESFGFKDIQSFIPNRFVEGYGMTIGAVDKIKSMDANLIITVDCGSLCHNEINYANSLGIDTVVTDHHNVAETPPPAVAAVNPRFGGHLYPFSDLAGVGVAFKLVQALQKELDGLPEGYEKWLLDLVALGTVCDIVKLTGENRANVYWGIEVMKKQRRTGLKALMAVANIDKADISAKTLGFVFGPRINAAGRMETASLALDMLISKNGDDALNKANYIDNLNSHRRQMQDDIFKEACKIALDYKDDDVLVINGKNWNHGIIGIVAAKILEKFKKPVYILAEDDNGETKGSARSFGDFSAADAVRAADDIIIKGGGHAAAAGVTLKNDKISDFRQRVNEFYSSLQLNNQERYLLPKADVEIDDFSEINEDLVGKIATMEPFGNGNPEPVIKITAADIVNVQHMGTDGQHIKLSARDSDGAVIRMLAFNAPENFLCKPGDTASIWFRPVINEWQGIRSVEGELLHLQLVHPVN